MRIDGRDFRTIWLDEGGWDVWVIDQRRLPHRFETRRLASAEDMALAISDMTVRGAPLIGAAAAWGMALACREDASDEGLALLGAGSSVMRMVQHKQPDHPEPEIACEA